MTVIGNFNVLTESWISVEGDKGAREELGILAALGQAHELKAIRDPSPLVEFSLYRLLVAFVLDALAESGDAPTDEFDLQDLLQAGRFDAEFFDAYVQRCGGVFDLFDPERPFLQTVAAAGGEKPLAAIYPAVPSGTNVDHWHHAREEAMGMDPGGAARLLTTIAPFMTAGGAGFSPSVNGSPAIYALPLGQNLFETIVLNLPLRQAGSGTGKVVWRDERIPGGERSQATMGEALTWRARRVRLVPPPEGAPRRVSRMFFQPGDSTRLTWTDPNLAYKYTGDEQTPIRMRAGRPLWRDAGPLALLNRSVYKAQEGKVEYRRPDVVEDAFRVLEGPLRIRVYGMRTDLKMKVFEWSVADLVVPSAVGRSARVGAQVQRWLDCAELAGRSVRNGIRNLYPREGAGNKAALGRTAEMAERSYWLTLESGFVGLMERAANLAENDVDDPIKSAAAVAPWKAAIRRQAVEAFEVAANDFDADADALERAVVARRRLYASLKRILE